MIVRKPLAKPPLVEAMFELRWKLSPQKIPGLENLELEGDPHYKFLLGRFSEAVGKEYPLHEDLPEARLPEAMAAHRTQYRFRVGEDEWPIIQIGPGIMTVNETNSYTWDGFRNRCADAVGWLCDAYPSKQEFDVQGLALHYANAVEVNPAKENLLAYLREKMGTTVSLPESLFTDEQVETAPSSLDLQIRFPCLPSKMGVSLRFFNGKRDDKPGLVWEMVVRTAEGGNPSIPNGFPAWLDKAHDLADDWFYKLIEGELEKEFSGG